MSFFELIPVYARLGFVVGFGGIATCLLIGAVKVDVSQRVRYAWVLMATGTVALLLPIMSRYNFNTYVEVLADVRAANFVGGWILTILCYWIVAIPPLSLLVVMYIYMRPVKYSRGEVVNKRYARKHSNRVELPGRHTLQG